MSALMRNWMAISSTLGIMSHNKIFAACMEIAEIGKDGKFLGFNFHFQYHWEVRNIFASDYTKWKVNSFVHTSLCMLHYPLDELLLGHHHAAAHTQY